jgi:hypothetical protein
MKRIIVSLVAVAALVAPASWASVAAAQSGNGQTNDANGDVHSNCHTGSKFLGAGGNDKGDLSDCFAAPVTPPAAPAAPGPAAAATPAGAPSAPRAPAAAPARAPAVAAVAVPAAPRTTG